MKKVMTILGTRPEIIKLSPVLPLLDQYFRHIIVHTGQHYSYNMDQIFFEELQLRLPDYNLAVGSGTAAYQTGTMLIKIEEVVLPEKPDFILVQGDTNTTMAGALVAAKLGIPLAHVEAGYRSGNKTQPEEINRIIADCFSRYLFAGNEECMQHLLHDGIPQEYIHLVGNTAIDALRRNEPLATTQILWKLQLEPQRYAVLTLHRAENTDNPETLRSILDALQYLSTKIRIIFPIHPRTRQALERYNFTLPSSIVVLQPEGYLDFIALMKHARFILTDSGGIQEESVELNVPCFILRNEVENHELLQAGKTILATTKTNEIITAVEGVIADERAWQSIRNRPFAGKAGVAQKIVKILVAELKE